MTAVDTNVLVGLLAGTKDETQIAQRALTAAALEGPLILCPAVYAELMALPGLSEEALDDFVEESDLTVERALAPEVWRSAGQAYGA